MQLLFSTITFIVIFTTLYSYGQVISKNIYDNKFEDIFFKILIGYTFIGTLTLVVHFFFKINNLISFLIVALAIIFFILSYFKNHKKEFLIILFLIILLTPLFYGYSDHPIDANMYHHPYISYLKSEKIIFGIANIQFRFGHISFLQYVQSALTNDYLHMISISSINIIFYISFIFFISEKIFNQKKFDYVFLIKILIVSFLLIKFARYREYGNDLIPLLVGFYFFIQILETLGSNKTYQKNLINLALPFCAFMFAHKISYTFSVLIFLVLIDFKKLNFFKQINFRYFLVFFVILMPWLLKNYITTSCFVYPIEISCLPNSLYQLSGLANPSNASFLTEVWSKGFIDHPDWQNLDLKEYMRGFNWLSTWMGGHFIKILEIMSPLFFISFLVFFYLFINKKSFENKKPFYNFKKKYTYLWFLIFVGLFIWFYKAPIYRYGAFYIISITVLSFIIFLDYFFKSKILINLKFFKNIFLISLVFFTLKNTLRIYKSDNPFFPRTVNEINKIEFKNFYTEDLKMLTVDGDVCYYTKSICSHEIPRGIKVKKLKNYYILTQ
jgi:hypothetical protein